MSLFFKIFQHILPNGRAWNLVQDKCLRAFFQGLDFANEKLYFDQIWQDIFPNDTRQLEQWEEQFGLPDTNLTEQERRARLDATWKETGGQSPRYIQDTLQANGFQVFVHEWWEPGTEPAIGSHLCATPRNPFLVLQDDTAPPQYTVLCGGLLSECGEVTAECGEALQPTGYPLVNLVAENQLVLSALCGAAIAECGESLAACDERSLIVTTRRTYSLPVEVEKWAYVLYIGGEVFPDHVTIDPARRDEFEALCLKITPQSTLPLPTSPCHPKPIPTR